MGASRVNTLVSDIYGAEGCSNLGLPASMTAAYFGKLSSLKSTELKGMADGDCLAALLMLVVQESVVLARAFSQLVAEETGITPPVFFVGGFLKNNLAARRIIAR